MNCERDIRFELLARLCPNSTGIDDPLTMKQLFCLLEFVLTLGFVNLVFLQELIFEVYALKQECTQSELGERL